MAKTRSPNYPAISLSDALNKARAIYDQEPHRHKVAKEVIAKHLGYNGLNGASLPVISALSKYGLLEGRGDGLALTEDAFTLLVDLPESPQRLAALNRAAAAPTLFSELDKIDGGALSEAALEAHLLKNGFIRRAASDAIRAYRETKALVAAEDAAHNAGIVNDVVRQANEKERGESQERRMSPHERQQERLHHLSAHEPDLKLKIGPDCVVLIDFKGPVTQRAIDKLIAQLSLVKDDYPETVEQDSDA